MLTHRQRKRLPKPKDIAMMWRALQGSVPMHTKPCHGLRESYRGVVNYRIESSTDERQWTVDVYHGEYFVVTTHGYSQPCPSIPSAIGHLKRMLRHGIGITLGNINSRSIGPTQSFGNKGLKSRQNGLPRCILRVEATQ